MSPAITVGISQCLLGANVRYDGGHKRDALCNEVLGQIFQFQPVCPEMAIGLGAPREIIRLVEQPDRNTLKAIQLTEPVRDITDELRQYGETMASEMQQISGYIFCPKSPSCGLFRVKRYRAIDSDTPIQHDARGVFAEAFTRRLPLLPVEEQGRLQDAQLRENFVMRVQVYHRWQQLMVSEPDLHGLMEFYRRHKLLLLAHNQRIYRQLGPFLARAHEMPLQEVAERIISSVMQALAKPSNRKNHSNVLMHLQGYLKKQLSSKEKQSLAKIIDRYRRGETPLAVPLTLLQHYFEVYPNRYISEQVYLNAFYPHTSPVQAHQQ